MARLLLERDTEMRALEHHLAQAGTGAGCLVLVDGPAGIGKSSLLAHAAHFAEASGFRVLRARGGPLEQSAGWGITQQLLIPVFQSPEWEELAVGAAALARRILWPDPDIPVLGGDAMHAAARGLSWLVYGLAERSPTLLVVDDIHWADLPSLRWLVQLTHQLPGLPLAILCAIRTGERSSDAGVLDELLTVSASPIRPRPLGPCAVESIVRARLPGAGAKFAGTCGAVTAGNPFLLSALVDYLLAEQLEPTDELAATLDTFGPEQISRSVRQQLGRLPDGAEGLAIAFAVLGGEAPLRHAGALAGLAPPDALRLADAVQAAGLLVTDHGAYAFVHPLVRSALYNALPPGQRGLWHGRAAQLLERERADPEAVALHLLHTEPFGDPATVNLLQISARHAGARGAPESAAIFVRRALAEPPANRGLEAELRSELGLALAAYLQPEAPSLLSGAVDLADSPDQRARIALSGARALGLAGHFDAAIRVCRRGLQQPAGTSPALSVRLEAELVGNAWTQASTVAEARDRLSRVSAATRASGLWRVNAAMQAVADGRPAAEARALLHPALLDGTFDREPDTILATVAKLGLIACGDLDFARELAGALIDAARPRGWLIALAHGSFIRAIVLVHAGRVRDAEADARLSFDYKLAVSPPAALIWSLFPLVDALTELGALADADAALAEAGQLADPPPGALGAPMLLESRARLRLAQGRPGDAHIDAQAAAERWTELGIVHPGLAAWRVVDAEALVALGDRVGARRLATEHLDLAARVALAGPRGAGLRALSRAAERDETVELLEQAVAVLADSPAQLEHVRALVELGAALRRANRREPAIAALRRALHLASRGGMQRLAQHSREELHACGTRPRRTAVSGIESLTPAEYRVARLAACGKSNPEIAQQLYVTRRTVETHLTHAFQKLRITARAEVPTQLAAPSRAEPVSV